MKDYEIVVGLEVHAELNTDSKIYCDCKNAFGLEVNTQVCPICMGMPGTLPTLNKKVVGIFPPIKPMHPGRWAPLGKYAEVIFKDIECSKCRKSTHCECIEAVKPEEVFQKLEKIISL